MATDKQRKRVQMFRYPANWMRRTRQVVTNHIAEHFDLDYAFVHATFKRPSKATRSKRLLPYGRYPTVTDKL